ncbi:MAG: VWA domain-containing protein [Acidobacteria bacterium]|nr:VWA domain-containing protein [Acidobacteriota bacterium]
MKAAIGPVVTMLLAALPAAAQEAPLPNLFSDVMDVRVVNVEAVVTDRKGNRVLGLEAGDFELLVDGEPVPIDYFTEIDEGLAVASQDDGAESVPSLTPDEPVGTNFLIFIDELFAIRRQRDGFLNRLERDLALLDPSDQVAIVAFDGYNVTRLTDWTNSRHKMEEAIGQARERKALGLTRILGLGNLEDQIRRTVMAATASIRSLADVPGRKVMLLLVETYCAPNRSWAFSSFWQEGTCWESVGNVYEPLVTTANLVGYTVYPVDMAGLRPTFGLDPGTGALLMNTSVEVPEAALWFLAHETGGKAMINAYRKVALAETVADTRSYYWLGFEPPRDKNDMRHDIEVRVVGRQGLRVRTRTHYLDMSRSAEFTMLVEGSLMFGSTPGEGALEVRFGTPRKAGFRKILVPMWVTIPVDDLALLPIDGQWRNEVEFRISVADKYGDHSKNLGNRIPIVYPEAPPPGKTFVYGTELPILKREHRYLAAVYNPVTGEILSHRGTVGPR